MMKFMESMPAELAQVVQVVGSSFAILVGATVAYLLIGRGLKTLQHHDYLPEPLVRTFRRIALWGIVAATGLLLLQMLGVLQSVLAAVTGALALLAIGFVAVWSVLSNTLCSLILMIIRPYRVGDTLSLPPDELKGKVVNFNLIFTTLETDDGCLLQVPNNIFFQRPVVRKVGKWRIGLADQLYESKNATGERKPQEVQPAASDKAA
jgi:small-conductance mechanosensitive channel